MYAITLFKVKIKIIFLLFLVKVAFKKKKLNKKKLD